MADLLMNGVIGNESYGSVSRVAGSLRVQILVVVDDVGEQQRAGDGMFRLRDPGVGIGSGECGISRLRALDGLLQRNGNRRRSGLLGGARWQQEPAQRANVHPDLQKSLLAS